MPQQDAIRCFLIPVEGEVLLVPNASVAEIIDYHQPDPMPDAPQWMLGMIPWRGQVIPIVSFEVMNGRTAIARGERSRIAVLNRIQDGSELNFYGLLTQGFPSLVRVAKSELTPAPGGSGATAVTGGRVVWNQTPAVVPNLDVVEDMILRRDR